MKSLVLVQRSALYQSLQTSETELRSLWQCREERTFSKTSSGNWVGERVSSGHLAASLGFFGFGFIVRKIQSLFVLFYFFSFSLSMKDDCSSIMRNGKKGIRRKNMKGVEKWKGINVMLKKGVEEGN